MNRWPFILYALLALAGFGGAAICAASQNLVPGTKLK